MSRFRPAALALLAVVALLAVACSAPPTKEMDQAQGAIDAARSAGAERYASEEFTAAVAALDRSRDAATQRDYRQALNYALDARERARDAARAGADRMAQSRGNAEKNLHAATLARQQLETQLELATSTRITDRAIADARETFTAADKALQEARSAVERQDYAAANTVATDILKQLDAALEAVNTLLDARNPRRPARRVTR
jgi:hypothetical protein